MSKAKPKSDYTSLEEQLCEIVNRSGMKTNTLAVAAGVPQPVLYRFMTGSAGQKTMRLDTADKLCRFFGVRLTAPRWPKGRKEHKA